MKLNNNNEISFEAGLQKEWLVTNGIGGYVSSTIIGANTRKYHGLLVAPLTPPGRRFLILSKLDEALTIEGEEYPMYTNICKNFISQGHKRLTNFQKEYIPIFTYEIEGVEIKKFICMEHGRNSVTVFYTIHNPLEKPVKLTLAPVMNFRDFHTLHKNKEYKIEQEIQKRKVKVILDKHSETPIYMHCSTGIYKKHEQDIFKGMYYIEEEKRGMEAEEDLVVPGVYEIEIPAQTNKNVTFVCSLEANIEEIDGRDVINKEIIRISELVYDSELIPDEETASVDLKNRIKEYIVATDNFVVFRPSFGLHTIIAGYPWFLDWGRDSLISLEGIALIPKRYDIAKQILQTITRDIKYGLVPNGYSGYDNRPLYNSVDASLLLFEELKKYLNYTGDEKFVKELYPTLEKIIDAYQTGIDVDNNDIFMDEDGLISSGNGNTQNTWMDAKIGNYAVTPRNGKAVEINSMWYNAIRIMQEFALKWKGKDEAKKYDKLAGVIQKSFEEKFYNKKRKCLYDVLGDAKIRPNQIFALSLSYPVIDPRSEEANEILQTVTKKLLTPYGLKTLAKGEESYTEVYEGDVIKRDMSYHQGITWPWLLGLYYDALKNFIASERLKTKKKELEKALEEFREEVKETFLEEIEKGATIGNIREIYDSRKPYTARGSIAQAWSVAEIYRIILGK